MAVQLDALGPLVMGLTVLLALAVVAAAVLLATRHAARDSPADEIPRRAAAPAPSADASPPLSQQDQLRAVGLFLDRRGWRNARVVRHPGGVMVQGTPVTRGQLGPRYETAWLSDADLRALAHAAHGRRSDA